MKNLCKNIKNESNSLRASFVCRKTGKNCPRYDYFTKAMDAKFEVKGCLLLEDEEEVAEVIAADVKEEIKEVKVEEEKVEENQEKVKSVIKQQNKYYKGKNNKNYNNKK